MHAPLNCAQVPAALHCHTPQWTSGFVHAVPAGAVGQRWVSLRVAPTQSPLPHVYSVQSRVCMVSGWHVPT